MGYPYGFHCKSGLYVFFPKWVVYVAKIDFIIGLGKKGWDLSPFILSPDGITKNKNGSNKED
jgi:hypothetical protein